MSPENLSLSDVGEMTSMAVQVIGYDLFAEACGIRDDMSPLEKKGLINAWCDGIAVPDDDYLERMEQVHGLLMRFRHVIGNRAVKKWFGSKNPLLPDSTTPASCIAAGNVHNVVYAADVYMQNV